MMRYLRMFVFLILLFVVNNLFAQREANVWYFGENVGLDFNTGFPNVLNNSQMNTWEGSACYSDSLGNLLFYTDGKKMWTSNHTLMPNGLDLNGDSSSTESAIIVPKPQSDNIYYLFTVDFQAEDKGLCYSVIDLNLNNGLGDITAEKNVELLNPVPEKVTAVRHANGTDIWVIAHAWPTDTFFTYKITPQGLQTENPVISEVGSRHEPETEYNINSIGYMRVSPNGKKLALAMLKAQIFEVFDFDPQTGKVSNPIRVEMEADYPYGVEFSPSAKRLYMSAGIHVYQMNLEAGDSSAVVQSVTQIAESPENTMAFGALQLSTDGHIYIAHDNSSYLSRIKYPEKLAAECTFEMDAVYLEGKKSRLGLPNFLQSLFIPPTFNVQNTCAGDSVFFTLEGTSVDSVLWNFGDEASTENVSKQLNAKHMFETSGLYQITLISYKNEATYTEKRIISVNPKPVFDLGADTFLCESTIFDIQFDRSDMNFLWSDNEQDNRFITAQTQTLWLRLTDKITACAQTDTLKLNFVAPDQLFLGSDTTICYSDTLRLVVDNQLFNNFIWQDNASTNFQEISTPGKYFLNATDTLGCAVSDTIIISQFPVQEFNLGNDTSICSGTIYNLQVNNNFNVQQWNNQPTNAKNYPITQGGQYYCIALDMYSCTYTDTIHISIETPPQFDLGADTLICEDAQFEIDVSGTNATQFLWQDNSSATHHTISTQGLYTLTATNKCGTATDQRLVKYKFCGQLYIPNVISPNNDGKNDTFFINGLGQTNWMLSVYTRSGRKIYQSTEFNNNWDATQLTTGVYYYMLKHTEYNQKFSGFLHVYK